MIGDENNSVFEFEFCVSCGDITNVHITTPIDQRANYIYGCGQLCEKCASKIKLDKY